MAQRRAKRVSDLVSCSLNEGVATITLDDPDRLNCFSEQLVEDLHVALDQSEADSAKTIVFKSNGKGFSGGFDLSNLQNETDGDLLKRLVRVEQLLQRVRHCRSVTAAFVHGACYGAAADLVLACRIRIASSDARFLMPGMRFGITLGSRRLRDTIGESAAYQLLDRRKPFGSEEAISTGFITELAEADNRDEVLASRLQASNLYSSEAYAIRMRALTPDTRDSDMAALVNSVCEGSIKSRMLAYVKSIKKK